MQDDFADIGKYTVYRVLTDYGEFTFRKELEAVNFMLDIGTGRLPMQILHYDHLPEIYTTKEAVEEFWKIWGGK